MRKADLHLHTSASDDATLEPEWIFRQARELGLAALAFADHEGMANVEEGKRLSKVYGVAFLPGIEISSSWQGQLVHVLGYFPHGAAFSFETFLAESVWQERRRIQLLLLDRLRQQGVAVTVTEYDAEAQAGQAGTYHIPLYRLLLRKGFVSNVKDYGVMRKAANIKYLYPPVPEVIQAVHEAGGIAVLAHPGAQEGSFYRFDAEDIAALATEKLDGVEVFHHAHDEGQTDYYAQAADCLGLVKTGGSDIHHQDASGERGPGSWFCDWDEVLRYIVGVGLPHPHQPI